MVGMLARSALGAVFWIAVLTTKAIASEPRPFFNELNIDGGGIYVPGVGVGPAVGGTLATGIDFGPAGFETMLKGIYSPRLYGPSPPHSFVGILELGLRLRIFAKKVCFKFGPVYAFMTDLAPSPVTTARTWGVGPSFGVQYYSSLDYPVYVGFGFDTQFLFLQAIGRSFGETYLANVMGTVYFGVRLTLFEKLVSRTWRRR